jgi:hypothetical protein
LPTRRKYADNTPGDPDDFARMRPPRAGQRQPAAAGCSPRLMATA